MLYLWLRALHIIAMVAWMAGLFYLPRLYVYHTEYPENAAMLKVMERKLLRFIMNPAMILTLIFGISMLITNPDLLSHGWIHVKLTCVATLAIFHMVLAKWRKDFEKDYNPRSSKFYRLANEVPTLLLIVIVILAILKPF
jgi:putative membrane protein